MAEPGQTTKKNPPGLEVLPIPGDLPPPAGAPDLESQLGAARPTIEGFQLLRELARGGMGVVHEAWSPKLGRSVALKLILPDRLLDPDTLERLEREIAAQARLSHPGIVQLLATGRARGLPWLALELVPGETLESRLKRIGPLAAPLAASWARALAEAVAHAHAMGVLHRDLKPANVLLGPDQRPRLTDFGLARLEDDRRRLTMTGAILGSPAYMSPEQAVGDPRAIDARTDVYGLGAILYQMLAGVPPYRGGSAVEVLGAILARDPDPPSVHGPVDPGLEAICMRCMARACEDRYASARELAAALGEWDAERGTGRRRALLRPLLAAGGLGLGMALAAWALMPGDRTGETALPPPRPVPTPVERPPPDRLGELKDALLVTPTFSALLHAAEVAERAELVPAEGRGSLLTDPELDARLLFAFHARRVSRDPYRLRAGTPELALLARGDRPGGWSSLARAIQEPTLEQAREAIPPLSAWVYLALVTRTPESGTAQKALEEAGRADSSLWLVPLVRAQLGVLGGRPLEAQEALEPWSAAGADDLPPPLLAWRALTRHASLVLEEARLDVDRAVERAPDLPDAWLARALVRSTQGEQVQALQDVARAAAILRDEGPLLRLVRGLVLLRLDRWDAARDELLRVVDEGPPLVRGQAIEGAALASLELGDPTGAAELRRRHPAGQLNPELERLLEVELRRPVPSDLAPEQALQYARARADVGDHRAAARVLSRLIRATRDPGEARQALLARAHTRLALGHWGAASRDYAQAHAAGGLPDGERLMLVHCLISIGAWSEAEEHLTPLRSRPPDSWDEQLQAYRLAVLTGRGDDEQSERLLGSAPSSGQRSVVLELRSRARMARKSWSLAQDDLRLLLAGSDGELDQLGGRAELSRRLSRAARALAGQ